HTVKVWDARNGRLLQTLEGHSDAVYPVAFSPDNLRLASGSQDSTVRIWDVRSGRLLQTLEGHCRLVHSVAFSVDGTRLASGSWDNTVKLWEARSGSLLGTLLALPGGQWITFIPGGAYHGSDGIEERIMMAFEYVDEDIKLRLGAIGARRDPEKVRAALAGQTPAPRPTAAARRLTIHMSSPPRQIMD
ncbi:MAG: WD40 repeat domain-containing protein, partial [Candidatus Dormibacteraceae bacterium]